MESLVSVVVIHFRQKQLNLLIDLCIIHKWIFNLTTKQNLKT